MEQAQPFLTFLWHQGILTVILWLNVTSILQTWSTKKSHTSFFLYTEYNSVFVIWKGYFFRKGYVGEEIIASLGFLSSFSGHRPALREWARTGLITPMQGAIPTQSHTTGSQGPLLISNIDVGSFTSHMNRSVKVLWDWTCGFSSLSDIRVLKKVWV